ncbi:MAG: hypothetical protein FE78DRAFT_89817 [Acidomyces sp. 'richmondensis']|nr:MAG: hypothetical protein FE78DRAFT_89817 [Acidomyces sp. 'richmondensis']
MMSGEAGGGARRRGADAGTDKCSTPPGGDPSVKVLLTFPVFDKRILSQSHWNACDDQGRIKVELSAGYQFNGGYINLVDHVIFAFQPAPMGSSPPSSPHPRPPILFDWCGQRFSSRITPA